MQIKQQTIKLVLLDRDGVINYDSPDYIKSPDEWHALPGSLAAIAQLNQANIKVAIVTNQSGLHRQLFSAATLSAIHQKLSNQLAELGGHIDAIFYCPHGPDNQCDCRKPKPGMLHQALDYFAIAANQTCFIGDSYKDIMAAQAAHCHPILVRTGNGQTVLDTKDLTKFYNAAGLQVYDDLASCITQLLFAS